LTGMDQDQIPPTLSVVSLLHNSTEIRSVVSDIKHVDRQTDRQTYFSYYETHSCNEPIKFKSPRHGHPNGRFSVYKNLPEAQEMAYL
jgi:hypothetical protein